MKKRLLLLTVILAFASCNTTVVTKPEKLLSEDEMVAIIYDLTVMEGMRTQNPYSPQNRSINPKEYIYKKYQIDSLQLTQNNQYYASQIDIYKKIYEKVNERIQKEKKETDSLIKINNTKPILPKDSNSDKPQVK
jgi:hypothetical protein